MVPVVHTKAPTNDTLIIDSSAYYFEWLINHLSKQRSKYSSFNVTNDKEMHQNCLFKMLEPGSVQNVCLIVFWVIKRLFN